MIGQAIPDGGIGALGGVMVPGITEWPHVRRGDPEYLLDLRVTYRMDRDPVPPTTHVDHQAHTLNSATVPRLP